MNFIDEVTILAKAGDGSDGFKKTKSFRYIRKNIPQIGKGGNGGSIWLISDEKVESLYDIYLKKIFSAQKGENGKYNNCAGKNGRDIFIKVPVGTIVINENNKNIISYMNNPNKKLLIAKGGKNGLEYIKFDKISKDCVRRKIRGEKGQISLIKLIFIIYADIGLFGLPNSGRSSFISMVSSAKPQIDSYPFTTLTPTIGMLNRSKNNNFKIIDIPSIINGSNHGRGLGIKFLKHIKNCKLILHFIDISHESINYIINGIKIVFRELEYYDINLINKECWLIFNKMDLNILNKAKKKVKTIIEKISWKNKYYLISSLNKQTIEILYYDIVSYLEK